MANEKPGTQEAARDSEGVETTASEARPQPSRAGQSDVPKEVARTYTLVISINERPGAVDRVVGLLRRRRANMQTLTIGRGEQPDVARITAVINDSEVAVDHLVEQLRKVVDVRQVTNLSSDMLVERELALIKVASDPRRSNEIIELGQQFGAYLADVAPESVTLEVTGSSAKVEKLVSLLQPFGIREVARTGSVAMPRDMK
ncbi:MAG TPA: acetolactate synthase small subunit [Ktedonobacteraceae bacterium]|jgi:acetolactate synthase-1/3 small subunit|nr:acetolactate synthase small subunit [Ktedonobacteraceae bacterium]